MKVESKALNQLNFSIDFKSLNTSERVFEKYLKVALKELETKEFLEKSQKERFSAVYKKLEQGLKVLEDLSQKEVDGTTSETLGDFLLSQALEANKILETLPDTSLKNLLKEWAFFIGVEAQKIKQRFYS